MYINIVMHVVVFTGIADRLNYVLFMYILFCMTRFAGQLVTVVDSCTRVYSRTMFANMNVFRLLMAGHVTLCNVPYVLRTICSVTAANLLANVYYFQKLVPNAYGV